MTPRDRAEWHNVLVESGAWSPERFEGWWARMHPPRPSKAVAAMNIALFLAIASMLPIRTLIALAGGSWILMVRYGHRLA